MTAGQYDEAQRVFDEFNLEYGKIRSAITEHTAGEGIFVKPFMKHMGRPSGPSRLPSRDNVVTPEVMGMIKDLMDRADSIVESAQVSS